MLHRAATLALVLALPFSTACKSRKASPAAVVTAPDAQVGGPDAAEPEAGARNQGSKWASGEPGEDEPAGGMQMFKEAWVYVDGRPVGVLRETEMPDRLPVAWTKEEGDIAFTADSTGPRSLWFYTKRWRVSDYLTAVGVDLKQIKMVVFHGGRGVVAISGDVFREYKDGLRFDLTGINRMKLRVFLPRGMPRDTAFDRYVAISVIVDKPVPELDRRANALMLDGEVIGGIPYHGAPLRGGVRIYLDGRLAMVLKRNALGDVGKLPGATPSWNLGALLAATGLDTANIAAAEVVHRDRRKRVENFDLATFNIAADEGASGKILVAGSKQIVEALQLFSKGKVPGPWTPEPMEKFLDGKVKEPYPEDDTDDDDAAADAIDKGLPPPAPKQP